MTEDDSAALIAELTKDMLEAADNLEFERTAYLRDQIKELKKKGVAHVQTEDAGTRKSAAGGKRGKRKGKA